MKKPHIFIYTGLGIIGLSLFLELFFRFDPYHILRWVGVFVMCVGAWLNYRDADAKKRLKMRKIYIGVAAGAILLLGYFCFRFHLF